jgi:hypothetical protein
VLLVGVRYRVNITMVIPVVRDMDARDRHSDRCSLAGMHGTMDDVPMWEHSI